MHLIGDEEVVMIALVVTFAVIVVVLALGGIIDPRGAWQATEAWKYRDPEANEPSDAAYDLRRVGGVIGLITMIVATGILVSISNDGEEEDDVHVPSSAGSGYTMPDFSSAWQQRDIGPGTIVGYDYPSALTIRIVALDSAGGLSVSGGCTTSAWAYEQSNAIVVSVTRRETSDVEGNFTRGCPAELTEQTVTTVPLRQPLGDRPIVTAAAVAAPTGGLTLGPDVRPEPLAEVPAPGVYQPLTPVQIDPTWVRVPLLAGVDSLRGY